MTMPEKLQARPAGGRISFFAPVSLFFFFFLMLIITTMRGIELHPMNYFLPGRGLLSFHLLLAYSGGPHSIHLAFAICSAVSIFLVVSYLPSGGGDAFCHTRSRIGPNSSIWSHFPYAFFLKGFTVSRLRAVQSSLCL